MSELLSRINAVNDVRKIAPEDLPRLAEEIRRLIIDVVRKSGGHLGSNLGVVELTLALHHVFDLTKDMIVWDGSYQTYTHKILTGRKDRIHTLRQFGGLSGFGWKPESETDPFSFEAVVPLQVTPVSPGVSEITGVGESAVENIDMALTASGNLLCTLFQAGQDVLIGLIVTSLQQVTQSAADNLVSQLVGLRLCQGG